MKVMLLQFLTNILSPPPQTKHPKDDSTVRKINFDISPPNIISHMSLTMPNMIYTLNSSNDRVELSIFVIPSTFLTIKINSWKYLAKSHPTRHPSKA